ncbi:MAG: hypothetical protein ACRYGK_03335 [Janthinobacterium lividum]
MKKTGMAKSAAKKLMGMTLAPGAPMYGLGEAAPLDRREQRKLDQAAGLVPFAIKLNSDLVQTLQNQARERGIELNELVAQLLAKGLEANQDAAQ